MTVLTEARRSAHDVRSLISFRVAGLRGGSRRTAWIVAGVFVVLTAAAVTVPAFVPGAGSSARAHDLLILLPTALLAFLVTTTLAIIGAGGGRELLPRDEGVAYPVSPTTDHLGALLLAPLNVAWMLQAWSLLGAAAFASGSGQLWAVTIVMLLWLLAATTSAQAIAWGVEWVRRGPRGVLIVRLAGLFLGLGVATLVGTDRLIRVLDHSPTLRVVVVALDGRDRHWWSWLSGVAVLVLSLAVAVAVGTWANHAVTRRQPREELHETGRTFTPREMPTSDLAILVRTDRASVWRSVPLRRGFVVLALLPGLVAAAGRLEWDMLPILPGLVAAGGALLFGVNAWCLDASGALWRDSLPVEPTKVFFARVRVLTEVLLVATVVSLLVAGTRAGGAPTAAQLASLVTTTVVVTFQVVARSMHWSMRRPFAMDLRSSRGTPAPPSAMVVYSSYLAFASTMTGMLFTITAQAGRPLWAFILGVPFAIAAVRRIVITAGDWERPEVRSWVVAIVAAR